MVQVLFVGSITFINVADMALLTEKADATAATKAATKAHEVEKSALMQKMNGTTANITQ